MLPTLPRGLFAIVPVVALRPVVLASLLLGASLAGGAHAVACDADASGSITVTDGVNALRRAALLPSICDGEPSRCDANGDGSVTLTDGVNVLRAAASLPSACGAAPTPTATPGATNVPSTSAAVTPTATPTPTSACGNGIVEDDLGETCDPPGSPQPPFDDPCTNDCTYCGDGRINGGESCELGEPSCAFSLEVGLASLSACTACFAESGICECGLAIPSICNPCAVCAASQECNGGLQCLSCVYACRGTAARCAPPTAAVQCTDGLFGAPNGLCTACSDAEPCPGEFQCNACVSECSGSTNRCGLLLSRVTCEDGVF